MLVAQEDGVSVIKPLKADGQVEIDLRTGLAKAKDGVVVIYEDGVLTADEVEANQTTGEVSAHGNVRIQRDSRDLG